MAGACAKPDLGAVWRWLAHVPDPEIPAVSVVDLGIVRDAAWEDEALVVTVTPTYSGCPATAVIALSIETALKDHGLKDVRIAQQLSPAWTTDWITAEGRAKLKAYGIAPPAAEASCAGALKAPPQVDCPRCGSGATERISQFGSTPCKASYRCTACLEPFDYFKPF